MYALKSKSKERSLDRVLIVRPIEGEQVKSSTGLVDPRLFNGSNKLHVIKDTSKQLWKFKYDAGGLPEPLKGQYTSFNNAFDAAKIYLRKRNIEITEVVD